jgi:hypothetical protein
MAQPEAKPFSTRLPADLQAALHARLAKTGEKRNAMMVRLIRADLGLDRPAPRPASVTGRIKPHIGKDGVQVGPQKAPAGALLDRKAYQKWRL